jgi:hypothetical protein
MPSVETFIVRIFVPAGSEHVDLVGVVEHVRSGRVHRFHGRDELLDAVLYRLGPEQRGTGESPDGLEPKEDAS